jgi:prevent-host-death family protein
MLYLTRLDLVRLWDAGMVTINIYEAKAKLSKLVERAAAGEEVIIARGGRPAARLTQLTPARRQIRFGLMRGRVTTTADFDAPLEAGDLSPFEGS